MVRREAVLPIGVSYKACAMSATAGVRTWPADAAPPLISTVDEEKKKKKKKKKKKYKLIKLSSAAPSAARRPSKPGGSAVPAIPLPRRARAVGFTRMEMEDVMHLWYFAQELHCDVCCAVAAAYALPKDAMLFQENCCNIESVFSAESMIGNDNLFDGCRAAAASAVWQPDNAWLDLCVKRAGAEDLKQTYPKVYMGIENLEFYDESTSQTCCADAAEAEAIAMLIHHCVEAEATALRMESEALGFFRWDPAGPHRPRPSHAPLNIYSSDSEESDDVTLSLSDIIKSEESDHEA